MAMRRNSLSIVGLRTDATILRAVPACSRRAARASPSTRPALQQKSGPRAHFLTRHRNPLDGASPPSIASDYRRTPAGPSRRRFAPKEALPARIPALRSAASCLARAHLRSCRLEPAPPRRRSDGLEAAECEKGPRSHEDHPQSAARDLPAHGGALVVGMILAGGGKLTPAGFSAPGAPAACRSTRAAVATRPAQLRRPGRGGPAGGGLGAAR